MKSVITAALLAVAATAVFAQASAPGAAASTVRQKIAKKYRAAKAKHPPASAVNPETSVDKKGGN